MLMCSSSLQAPAIGRNVSLETVDGRTRKLCSGVPTRTTNVDHFPSFPSKYWDGANEIGAAVAAARGALTDDILILGVTTHARFPEGGLLNAWLIALPVSIVHCRRYMGQANSNSVADRG